MTLMNMNNLAAAYRAAGQLDKALPLMEQTLDLKRKKFGPEHPETLNGMTNLAAVYWSAGSLDRSVPLFEAALAIEEKSLGRKHPTTQMTIANLGVNYVDSGKIEEGTSLLEEAMESSKERPGLAAWVREQLADAYIKGKRTESFQSLANDFITSARVQFPEGSLELAAALVSTADQYLRLAMFRPAADLLREGTAIRNQHTADAWNTFNAQSMWGGALLGLAQLEQDAIEKARLLAEAEPLLVAGYEGMKQRESTIPREAAGRIADALDRLIVFYTLLERPDEATKYRDLRSQAPANPADSTQ
jgi:tetratricopeptide (TPR) repeat protein